MKKLLSICLLATIGSGMCNAQQRYQKELLSDNELNYLYFSYDNGRIDSIYQAMPYDHYMSYRLFEYDKAGNNTVQKRYQCPKNADDYIYTDNVYYTYDENNNIITRKNYNLDFAGGTDSFILGGVYRYSYDVKGNLIKSQLFWDEEETRLYETIIYTYDSEGRMISNIRSSNQFGEIIEDTRQDYEYDTEGRLVKVSVFMLNYNTGSLDIDNYDTYTYDDNGNIIEMKNMLADGTVMEKHEYKYDTTTESAETIFPESPNDKNFLFNSTKNIVTQDNIFMRDLKAGELIYVDTERWIYGDNDMAGISSVSRNAGNMNVVSITPDKVVLGNVSNSANIRIYDVSGRMIYNKAYRGGVDVTNLPSGVYMIVSGSSSIKINK